MAVRTGEKRLGPQGGAADGRGDAPTAQGKDARSAAKQGDVGPLGGAAVPGRVGGRSKTKVVDKSTTNVTTTDNSKTNVTDRSRDRSRSVKTGDVSGAKTGDVSVPVSAVPG